MAEPRPKEFVYKTTLVSLYGLTPTLIKQLGQPDKLVENPHYRSGPPSSLYRIERVEAFVEANAEAVRRAAELRAKRSASALAVAQAKRESLLDWARSISVSVRRLPADIERIAQAHYDNLNYDYDDDRRVNDSGIVAYIRHNYTNYEKLLAEIDGKIGCHDAYQVIKARINTEAETALKATRSPAPA